MKSPNHLKTWTRRGKEANTIWATVQANFCENSIKNYLKSNKGWVEKKETGGNREQKQN